MQTNSSNDHTQNHTPPAAYTNLGNLNGLTSEARWSKEEAAIRQVLGLTLPDSAFNRIKTAATVKAAWEVLKRVYEERSKAVVADWQMWCVAKQE